MAESNGNGNGWRGALTTAGIIAGLVGASHVILDQKVESSKAERVVILEGMHDDLADHSRRVGLLEQHAAAMKETVREIETQFKWEGEVRALEDDHLKQMFELTHARNDR